MSDPPRDDISVLHVDDDRGLLDLTRDFLESRNDHMSVETTADPTEVPDLLEKRGHDVVVSDYQMPGMDGLDLLETIRSDRGSDVPFIMFTGKGREDVAMEALNLGADRYLQKGGDPSSQYGMLARAIEQVVEHTQTRRRLREREENLRTTLQSIGEGVITADESGDVVRMNAVAERLTGWAEAEAVGRPLGEVFDVVDRDGEPIEDPAETVLENGRTVGLANHTVLIDRDGEERHVADRAAPMTDGDGSVVGVVVVFRDVSEEYRERRRRRRQQDALVDLSTDEDVVEGNLRPALRTITEAAAGTLDVPRVGIWLWNQDGTALRCVDLYDDATGDHASGATLVADEYPAYFEALRSHRTIAVSAAGDDPRTAELGAYLAENDVASLLDSAIRLRGEVVGVVCHEAVGDSREWTEDEIRFGAAIADQVSRVLSNRRWKRRERELQRYETVVEALGDPVYALDADGRYTFVNDAFVAATGYEKEEIVGEHVSRVVPEPYVEESRETIRELLTDDDRSTARMEIERVTADGERARVENHLALLPSEDGSFRGTAGVLRDVTDRTAYERTIEQLHAATRGLVTAETPAEIVERGSRAVDEVLGFGTNSIRLYDSETGTLGVVARSERSETMLGELRPYDADDSPAGEAFRSGDPAIDAVAEDDPHGRDPLSEALYVPLGDHGVLSIGVVDGEFDGADVRLAKTLAANMEAALDRAEQERGLRRRERELERQNERLEEFASIVSHDLRNPLNVAEGHLELLREECDSDRIDDIRTAHDRMGSLIDDLLTLARQGATVDDPEPTALSAIARRAWELVDTRAADLTATAETDVRADPERLCQVFENLFRNAVEHGGVDVTVRVGTLPDDAGFYVADDGPGVPEAERGRIFESGVTTAAGGTGFGLSIVEEIVEAHGWEIRATEGEAGGARFEVRGVEFVE